MVFLWTTSDFNHLSLSYAFWKQSIYYNWIKRFFDTNGLKGVKQQPFHIEELISWEVVTLSQTEWSTEVSIHSPRKGDQRNSVPVEHSSKTTSQRPPSTAAGRQLSTSLGKDLHSRITNTHNNNNDLSCSEWVHLKPLRQNRSIVGEYSISSVFGQKRDVSTGWVRATEEFLNQRLILKGRCGCWSLLGHGERWPEGIFAVSSYNAIGIPRWTLVVVMNAFSDPSSLGQTLTVRLLRCWISAVASLSFTEWNIERLSAE